MKLIDAKASDIKAGDYLAYYGTPRKIIRIKNHVSATLPMVHCFEIMLAETGGNLPITYMYRYADESVKVWIVTET